MKRKSKGICIKLIACAVITPDAICKIGNPEFYALQALLGFVK